MPRRPHPRHLSPTAQPAAWAQAQHDLGIAYQEDLQGDRAENLERAIEAYRQALTVRTPAAMPREWAETMVNLGVAWSDRIRGTAADNLEEAIRCYERALEVLTAEAAPLDRAATLINLGSAYAHRLRGERADNLERAIATYEEALAALAKESAPAYWAAAMGNLGNAYLDRLCGRRAENVERAIAAYYGALEVETREKAPVEWAATMMNLGNAFMLRIRGERADNLDDAIAAYRAALEVRRREAMPVEWAEVMTNLGNAYVERQHGERSKNLELAILAYRYALTVRTREAMPAAWAQTQSNLGTACLRRVEGDRAESVEKAIACYRAALTVQTREAWPTKWAATTMNLATAWRNRVRGDRAENLERGIACCRQALTVRTRPSDPQAWATVMMNLGILLTHRLRGDRAANLEEAIRAYEAALEVQTAEELPLDWALTQMNLGTACFYRLLGDRAENLERALAAYEASLTVRSPQATPADWATSMTNLAAAYANRQRGDPSANLEAALAAYRRALSVQRREAVPLEWSITAGNLASVFTKRIRGDRAENLEQAIALYRQALEVQSREASPLYWALSQANLGYALSRRLHGGSEENLRDALAAYRQALTVYRPEALPVEARHAAFQLGDLCCQNGRWQEAVAAYEEALTAAEGLYQASLLTTTRQAELAVAPDLYRHGAYALARGGRLQEAATTLEQGRARSLGEALAREAVELEALRTRYPEHHAAFRQAVERRQALERAERALGPLAGEGPERLSFAQLQEEAARVAKATAAAVAAIRELPGWESFLRPPSFHEIARAALPHSPLLYLITTPWGSLGLLVSRASSEEASAQVTPLWEEGFREEDLDRLLVRRDGEVVSGGYLPGQMAGGGAFREELEDVLDLLGQRWLGPLAAHLTGAGIVAASVVPGGRLGLLPFHAARFQRKGEERWLLDEVTLSYAPSARALTAARQAREGRRTEEATLAGVGNPRPNRAPLPYARAELAEILAFFPEGACQPLYEGQATRGALLTATSQASHVHLACHGRFGPARPLESSLELADATLTLREILDAPPFSRARLVTLSACQTGLIELDQLPDESIGLPAGLLQAGVPGVVASLWGVADFSTALLMARFYHYLLAGGGGDGGPALSPAAALTQAQQWLREVTVGELVEEARRRGAGELAAEILACYWNHERPEERPFAPPVHWAPFLFVGA